MKKALKIIGITLASLIVVLVVAICIALWVVFTPERLTPIVQKESAKLLECESHIGRVELTFFSTFPDFGLKLDDVWLVNPMAEAPSDTLVSVKHLIASINLMAFMNDGAVQLNYFTLQDGAVNLFTDMNGVSNYMIMAPSDSVPEDTVSTPFTMTLDLEKVRFKNVALTYTDQSTGMGAQAQGINGDIKLLYNVDEMGGDVELTMEDVQLLMAGEVSLFATVPHLSIRADGKLKGDDGKGVLKLSVTDCSFAMDSVLFVDKQPLALHLPIEIRSGMEVFKTTDAMVRFGELELKLNGDVAMNDAGIMPDLEIKSNVWDTEYLLTLIPATSVEMLEGIDPKGELRFEAAITGTYSDTSLPEVAAMLHFDKGSVALTEPALLVENIFTTIKANVLLDSGEISSATIDYLKADMGGSHIELSGNLTDILGDVICDVKLKGDVGIDDVKPFLPDSLDMDISGRVEANMSARFKLSDATDMRLERIRAKGDLALRNFGAATDSMQVRSERIDVMLVMPSLKPQKRFKALADVTLKSNDIEAVLEGMGQVNLEQVTITAVASNPMDNKSPLCATAFLDVNYLHGVMDTMQLGIEQLQAQADYIPTTLQSDVTDMALVYFSKRLNVRLGDYAQLTTDDLGMVADVTYDVNNNGTLLSWNPQLVVDLRNARLVAADVNTPISVSQLNFNFSPGVCFINDSRFLIGSSDFSLHGELSNLDGYVNQTGLLVGVLDFESRHTDVNQLMDMVNGMGRTDTVVPLENPEDNPFMVPKGIDIRLNTKIDRALAGNGEFDNVAGALTIKDGVLILEQMGFTSKAAEMQLTAMYRSDRKNHLFAGVDFHLLDIDIRELIHLIPDIDTIVPMLKSFDGKAEFHLAAETYMKSNYDLKMSTLRGAAALEGKDLVVLDGETFSTIAKYMMFNKKTRNKIDTMSVEMTVFRDEVDVYPFLIVMDKYKAIISGRHNLDMSFNYNLSAIAPIRLGLDVSGNLDNMKYKLTKAENVTLFNPEKQKVVEAQTMKLKKMISDSLKANVKPREDEE